MNPEAESAREADKPVFVDESGTRGRTVRRIGWILGAACVVYAVVLVLTVASGSSDAPWMPGIGDDANSSGKVEPSPSPTAPVSPTSGSGTPLAPEETPRTQDPLPTAGPTGTPAVPPPDAAEPTQRPTQGGGTAPAPDPTATDPGTEPTTPQPDPDPPTETEDPGTTPTETDQPVTGGAGGGGAGGNGGSGDKPISADTTGSENETLTLAGAAT